MADSRCGFFRQRAEPAAPVEEVAPESDHNMLEYAGISGVLPHPSVVAAWPAPKPPNFRVWKCLRDGETQEGAPTAPPATGSVRQQPVRAIGSAPGEDPVDNRVSFKSGSRIVLRHGHRYYPQIRRSVAVGPSPV